MPEKTSDQARSHAASDTRDRIDFRALERRIPLDELPGFHRAFLNHNRPGEDFSHAPLRQVQGKVQATLKRLEREGRAREAGEALWVDVIAIPEAYRRYLAELDQQESRQGL